MREQIYVVASGKKRTDFNTESSGVFSLIFSNFFFNLSIPPVQAMIHSATCFKTSGDGFVWLIARPSKRSVLSKFSMHWYVVVISCL